MKTLVLLAILTFAAAPRAEPTLRYVTGGPMLHWNFSGNRFSSVSFGVEFAYWNYRFDPDEYCGLACPRPDLSRPGYGLALGFDLDRHGLRIHSEPQLGWVAAGLSLGPVIQISLADRPFAFGMQGSGWANAIVGGDIRYRRMTGRNFQSVGLYGKLGDLVE